LYTNYIIFGSYTGLQYVSGFSDKLTIEQTYLFILDIILNFLYFNQEINLNINY